MAGRKLRRRYIVCVSSDVSELAGILRARLAHPEFVRVILTRGEAGLIRVAHLDLEQAKHVLAQAGATVVGVSGTIKKARRKFFDRVQPSVTIVTDTTPGDRVS